MSQATTYLDPEVVSRLGRLDLVARLVVEGFITGLHRSPYHGFSVEFSEHRPYMPGDSLRSLDWKAYAKSNRLYVKQYEEETNLKAYLLLDASGSMAFQAGGSMSKFRYASCLAAALSYLLLRQRDATGLMLFQREIISYLPPRSMQSHLQQLLVTLTQAEPGADTHMGPAFHDLAERIARRGLVVVLSDLLDDPATVMAGLRHFRHRGHEVIVFHILDPREVDLELGDQTRFYDLETPDRTLTTQPWHIKGEYRQQMDELIQTYRYHCSEARIDYVQIDTSTPFDVALSRFLAHRKKLI
ncbi:MAG: DUF58 domain-containing protein [Candidatus Latescibacteria bacterium]|nr:DUF58 domain-containing protein [Candidatus Latescibacterota bacterium]